MCETDGSCAWLLRAIVRKQPQFFCKDQLGINVLALAAPNHQHELSIIAIARVWGETTGDCDSDIENSNGTKLHSILCAHNTKQSEETFSWGTHCEFRRTCTAFSVESSNNCHPEKEHGLLVTASNSGIHSEMCGV